MNICQKLIFIAKLIQADTKYEYDPNHGNKPLGKDWGWTNASWSNDQDYIWDPEHKKNPGSGYRRTDKGWSKSDGEGNITEMKQEKKIINPVKPTEEVKLQEKEKPTYVNLFKKSKSPEMKSAISILRKKNKGSILDDKAILEILQDPINLEDLSHKEKAAMVEFFEMKQKLWIEAMESADPQSEGHAVVKQGIKNIEEIISKLSTSEGIEKTPQPSEVTSRLFKEPGMVSPADKPKVIQTYKNWLAVNKDKEDKDTQAMVSDARLAIKMLEGPRFKKADPKLSGNLMYLVKDNDLGDELQELAGFKETIKNHPQMSNKEYRDRINQGIRLPRSQAQLKQAFITNMNPMNYPDMQAFQAAKQRVQKMDINDFGKLLASLNSEEEENI
ncbi:MAG: hypothetical protein M0P12_00935 [Paludibacteraceae bacterium]|nr:hypothetical protein [Paludibacteraceae bacterium]MCK9615180.1 hypothetical protein [Candidatus Omnitrophota bacterium]